MAALLLLIVATAAIWPEVTPTAHPVVDNRDIAPTTMATVPSTTAPTTSPTTAPTTPPPSAAPRTTHAPAPVRTTRAPVPAPAAQPKPAQDNGASGNDDGPAGSTDAGSTTPAQVRVPNITGQSKDGAVQTLKSAGLGVYWYYIANNDVPTDTVVRQTPSAGSEVDPGTSIHFTVARNYTP